MVHLQSNIKHPPNTRQKAKYPLKTGISAGRINMNYARGVSSLMPYRGRRRGGGLGRLGRSQK